jgi:hypothetical protein
MTFLRRLPIVTALIALVATTRPLGAQSASPDLAAVVDRFMALERARQAPGATAADVDRVLALMTDSVVYEHPRAGARLQGKAVLRQGMLSFVGSVRNARDSVIERTTAPGVVVIVSETQAEMLRDGTWVPLRRRGLRLFEFDGERVRRIIEYGW